MRDASWMAMLHTAGPGGLFYGGVASFNFTHGGDDFFAIDFARFVRGVPFANATLGTPVLNVQQGMVSGVRGNIARGSTANDNRVLVKHMTQGEWVMLVILEWLSGVPLRPGATPRFTSMYLHLDGPFRIPVSPGMFARQGANLGLMDDTGLSTDNHLHFSIHDRTLPASFSETALNPAGRSTRPTPMDGQRLAGSRRRSLPRLDERLRWRRRRQVSQPPQEVRDHRLRRAGLLIRETPIAVGARLMAELRAMWQGS